MKRYALMTWLLVIASASANAGSLSKGSWTPSGCGSKPEAPAIDGTSIDSYNSSIAVVKEWQQASQVYFDCIVKEANADNSLIADTTMKEQAQYRETAEKLSQDAMEISRQLNEQ